jgi:hypothetical protein
MEPREVFEKNTLVYAHDRYDSMTESGYFLRIAKICLLCESKSLGAKRSKADWIYVFETNYGTSKTAAFCFRQVGFWCG